MRRLGGWFKSLSLAGKVGVILATFFGIGVVGAAAQGPAPTPPKPASTNATSIQQPKPTVETKTETTTVSIPYTSSTVQDSTLAKGTTQNKTA